jgi:hypothetical protein
MMMMQKGPLAAEVREALNGYSAPPSPDARFGSTPFDLWVANQVQMMREALVEPFDAEALVEDGTMRPVVVVAEDGCGSFIVYDPTDAGDFALALGEVCSLRIDGPRGDAVGCFLAR